MPDLGGFLSVSGLGGGTIGAALVRLQLDTRQYNAELAKAQGTTVAATNTMGGTVGKFSGVAQAGMLAAGAAVVAFGANAIKAASDLGESLNKSNVVFGTNAKAIETWAHGGADAFGLSARAALDAAANFGTMLQSAGLATDASAEMSQALVELAGDLASFNNVDPTVALEKLRSGLAGEAEPLRQFGVFLSEAAVKAEAYQSGIADVGSELTEAQKVQARYNIIFEQTTKQQGDFQRTAESLPNQLRSARAEFENVSAAAGEKLLPVMTDLLEIANLIIPAIGTLTEHLGILAGPVGVIADLMGDSGFTGRVRALEKAMAPTAKQVVQFGQDVAGEVTPAVREFIPFLFRAADGQVELADATQESIDAIRTQTEAVIAQADAYLALADPVFAIIDAFRQDEEASRALEQARARLDRLTEAGKQGTKAYRDALQDLRAASLDAVKGQEDLNRAVQVLNGQIDAGLISFRDARERLREMGKQAGLSAPEIRALVDELRAGVREAGRFGEAGRQGGADFVAGLISAINSQAQQIYQAAYEAAQKAELGARAALESESPSKVAARIGRDFVEGFAEGIGAGGPLSEKAAERFAEQWTRAFEKQLSEAEAKLNQLRSRASSFRGTIKGGFSSFFDIGGALELTGGDIQSFFAQQVAGAQQFASVLQALQAQGAGQTLLSQIAGQGPEAIPFAQALLQQGPSGIAQINEAFATITQAQRGAGAALSEAFFGDKIDELKAEIREVRQELRDLRRDPIRMDVRGGGPTNELDRYVIGVVSRATLSRAPV